MADDKEPHAAGSDRAKESTKEAKARLPRCLPTLCAVPQCHSGFALGACRLSAVDMPAGTTCKGVWLGRGICARSDEIGTSANDVPRQSHATTDSQPHQRHSPLRGTRSTSCNVLHDAARRRGGGRLRLQLHLLPCLVRAGRPPDTACAACTLLQQSVTLVGRWHRTT